MTIKKEVYTIQEIVDMAKCPIDRNKELIFVEQVRKKFIDKAEVLKKIDEICGECMDKLFNKRKKDDGWCPLEELKKKVKVEQVQPTSNKLKVQRK